MTKFEEELKETYEKVSINLYGNNAGSIGMKKLLNELKDTGLLKEQQALPVVPECVAEWIEHCKGMGYGLIAALTFKLSSTMYEELSAKILKWLGNEGNDETFALAFITGKYQVEKPQLFYLRDELTGQFLAKDNQFKDRDRYFFWTGEDPLTHSIGTAWKLSFTQEEIDSMETGSYEQIEVEK
ncbi:DUF1642 domain-containing protein [Lactococcus lactis]|uniref:DUF1642 domain-containing protein n=1 Tax=Lactococcus lactis TaxID=1358 RepID=UPI00109C4754|nr:DUF1642 domain-containing protein [Lactococcus lactis]THA54533.1 DUF1642 domain-containing protein [Lactococcus lactis]